MVGASSIGGEIIGGFTNNFEFGEISSFAFATGSGYAGTLYLSVFEPSFDFVIEENSQILLVQDGAQFDFSVEDGVPAYATDTDGLPDIVVDRTGNDVTITIRNLNGRNVTIEKALSGKAQFSELVTTNTSPYVDSGVSDEPKYRAYFTFSGSIGGTAIESQGVTTRSRYTKE